MRKCIKFTTVLFIASLTFINSTVSMPIVFNKEIRSGSFPVNQDNFGDELNILFEENIDRKYPRSYMFVRRT